MLASISYTWWFIGGGVFAVLLVLRMSGFIRYIPNNRIGVVEKLVSARGSVKSGLMALHGEAGFEPDVLRGGWHLFFPFQYRIHILPLVAIPQGKIGYLYARDGSPLPPTQTLASNAQANDFGNVRAFLAAGGQRGPQRQILREGTYAINLVQFAVLTEAQSYYLPLSKGDDTVFSTMTDQLNDRDAFEPVVIKGKDDLVGIVTVHDGPSLGENDIICPPVGDDPANVATYHNKFQDAEHFLRAGGRRGRQLQVLVEGTYYINRLFATVETIPKTTIEVGNVGVVVSYTGAAGEDLSGSAYSHGEMVSQGNRGVWQNGLLPGKYAFNTYAGKLAVVPTTNVILKWIRAEVGQHHYDEHLAEVSLITKDAFEPLLPLSVVMHIDYRKAPLVIQRFGDIKRLVEQTLDPMVSAYFKNIGQTRTLIQLIQERSQIQKQASEEMKEKFQHYNLELEEVLIGTPVSPPGDTALEVILKQLRERQIALEQVETYTRQQTAAIKERELREAEARARQQQQLTESEVSITIQENHGKAEYQRSLQQAAQIRAMAQADADKAAALGIGNASAVRAMAEAEAEKAARVGIAQALAIEEQVRAYGGPRLQVTQQVMLRFAEAIQTAKVDVVPKIVISGSGGGGDNKLGGGSGNVLEAILAMLLSDKLGESVSGGGEPRSAEAGRYRDDIRQALLSKMEPTTPPKAPSAKG